jgi:hypothetical protein
MAILLVFLLLTVIVLLGYILAWMILLLAQLKDLRDAFFAVHDLKKGWGADEPQLAPDYCVIQRRNEHLLEPPLFYPCVCEEIDGGMCDEHVPRVVCPIHGKQAE